VFSVSLAKWKRGNALPVSRTNGDLFVNKIANATAIFVMHKVENVCNVIEDIMVSTVKKSARTVLEGAVVLQQVSAILVVKRGFMVDFVICRVLESAKNAIKMMENV
jgi:hypothetical protein